MSNIPSTSKGRKIIPTNTDLDGICFLFYFVQDNTYTIFNMHSHNWPIGWSVGAKIDMALNSTILLREGDVRHPAKLVAKGTLW